MGRKQCVAASKQMENYDLFLKDANLKIMKKTTDNAIKSYKCNQCDYASSHMGHLRAHLKMHSGEKSNQCNQCDYACSQTGTLRTHMQIHNVEKLNKEKAKKCNQCDYASSHAADLGKHLKMHSGEKSNKCNQCD